MTKRTKIFLAALVLVALLAHAYLYWWSKTSDHGVFDTLPFVKEVSDSASKAYPPTKATTPTTPATEGGSKPVTGDPVEMRTYEDTEFKFNFQYPATWDVSKTVVNGKTSYCLNVVSTAGRCYLTITSEKEGVNASAEKAVEAFTTEFRDQSVKTSSRKIGGEEADVLTVSGYKAEEMGVTRAAVFVHTPYVYTVSAEKGQETVFEGVVSSLKFY